MAEFTQWDGAAIFAGLRRRVGRLGGGLRWLARRPEGRTIISAESAYGLARLPLAPKWRSRVMPALWHGRSLRAQLLLVFVLIDIVAVLIAGSVAILRTRAQSRVEMAASMRLAELLVTDAVNFVHQPLPAEQFLAALPGQLRAVRHVRIAVKDAAGVPIAVTPPASNASVGTDDRKSAPAWFATLVAAPIDRHDIPVIINGRSVGQVEIIGEPGDEIAEFWENAVAIGTVAIVLNAAMIGILYVLFGRVLDPLTVLASGLSDLERQTYDVRLPKPRAQELAAIADRFNALARTLATVSAENIRLNRRLITAQDDERRRTALELHDEVGPCLFGLKANASSIASAAGHLPEQVRRSVSERLRDILAIIEHLQAINRSMLDRLRPMALGHVPLEEMLAQLMHERARLQPQISFSFRAGNLLRSYGDSIDLTIYRCVQESLTNAIRHAQARHVTVNLSHANAEGQLTLTVRDDGCGMTAGMPAGFGTRGMQERVEGLGGHYVVDSAAGRGTDLRITIPVVEPRNATDAAVPGGDRA
jgi:two-component system sensor histidine kinase UhpB